MPLIEDPVNKLMEQVLGFVNRRQDVITSNIANANTPGYKAFDAVLRESLGGGPRLEPARSNPRHMTLGADTAGSTGFELRRSRQPARLDGNNVNLDAELVKMLENRIKYDVTMELKDRWGSLKRAAREVR